MDANKKNGNPIGDYLVWIETLEEAARLKVDVLFVTRDTKEDWWRQERGQAKGPHPQLVEEMQRIAGVRLFMLRPASFLKHAGDLLQVRVSPESVQDAQRVTAQANIRFHAATVESEVVEKLRAAFGDSSVSPPNLMAMLYAIGNFRPDAVVSLPGKVPVVFEVKYTTRPSGLGNYISDALRRVDHAARSIDGRSVLVLIVSDEFTSEDLEGWIRQVEKRSMGLSTILHPIYTARYSDFLAESAQDFADRVISSDLPPL